MTTEPHVKEMALRRFWAGELAGAEKPAIEAHTAACARCRARLKEMNDEQRRFEQEISFDRFAAGVERAARTPRRVPAARGLSPSGPTMRWFFPLASVAAAVALTFTFAPRLRDGVTVDHALGRIKGGSGITVQIAPAGGGPQRTAAVGAFETLSPGERIRIGYQPGMHQFVTALSIDDQGEITPLYPEAGRSLPIGRSKGPSATRYLPDSVEFTGKGSERLIVILSDQALEVQSVKQAVSAAFEAARRDLTLLPALDLPGEQFHRTFVKP